MGAAACAGGGGGAGAGGAGGAGGVTEETLDGLVMFALFAFAAVFACLLPSEHRPHARFHPYLNPAWRLPSARIVSSWI